MPTRPTKDWQDSPSTATPIDAAALEDADDRGFDYTDDSITEHSADTTSVHGIADTTVLATDAELAAHAADTTAVHGITDTGAVIIEGDSRLTDARAVADNSVTAAKVNTTLKPSGSAATTDESLRRLGTGATHAAAGDDSRFPSAGQKNALAGTSGTPGTGNEYATKATTDGLQPLDSDLTAIAALTTTSYGRAFLALADAAAARTATGAQASDATLTALAGLATGADKLPYSTGTDTFSQADLTAAGRALLDDADAPAQLTTLGVSTFIKTLLDDADAAAARTTLSAAAVADLTVVTANTQTTDYTLVLGDAGKAVEMNAATAKTITIPLNASVAFPTGTVIEVHRYGAGTLAIAATGGVTIRSPGGLLSLASQYSTASLRKRATDEWVLNGDLSA